MDAVEIPTLSIYPEFLKGGIGHYYGDDCGGIDEVPYRKITLFVSDVDIYDDNDK